MKKTILMIVVAVVIAGVSGGGVYLWQNNKLQKSSLIQTTDKTDTLNTNNTIAGNIKAGEFKVSNKDLGIFDVGIQSGSTVQNVKMSKVFSTVIDGYAKLEKDIVANPQVMGPRFVATKAPIKVDAISFYGKSETDIPSNNARTSFFSKDAEVGVKLGCIASPDPDWTNFSAYPRLNKNSRIITSNLDSSAITPTKEGMENSAKNDEYVTGTGMGYPYKEGVYSGSVGDAIMITDEDIGKLIDSNANNRIKIEIRFAFLDPASSTIANFGVCSQMNLSRVISVKVL